MIRPCRLLVGLCLLSLVLAPSSWGQTGKKSDVGPSSLYNPKTVVTVSGIVVAKAPPSLQKGLPVLLYPTVQTDNRRKINVFLGPDLYVNQLPVQINTLNKVQVTGSKVTWQGKPLIVAEKIKKGDQVLKLREPNGVPVWSSHHRTKP